MQRKAESSQADRASDAPAIPDRASDPLAIRSSDDRGEPDREPDEPPEVASGGDDGATVARPQPRPPRRTRALVTALLVAPVLLLVVAFGVDRMMRRGEILRGVTVCGVNLGGLDRTGASRALREIADRARDEPFPVRVATRPFELVPQKIGYSLDVEQTLTRALAAGRDGNALAQLGWWMGRWFRPRRIAPVANLDEAGLGELVAQWEAEAIEDRPFEGDLRVEGLDVIPDYPRRGRGVVRDGLAARLLDAIALGGTEPLELPLGEIAPRRERDAIDRAAREAAKLTEGPVVLTAMVAPQKDGDEPDEALEPVDVTFSRQKLLEALRARSASDAEDRLEPYFEVEAIDRVIATVRAGIEQPPRDARFEIDKRDKVTVVPGAPGTLLDAAKVTEAVLAAARTAERRGALPVERGARPKLDTEKARALGITKLTGNFTTQHPCCQPRVQNIHRIADTVDGTPV